jgi:signal transduction histidine kinase
MIEQASTASGGRGASAVNSPEAVLRPISLRGDAIVRGATLVHLLLALLLANAHHTWVAALVVGTLVVAAFSACAALFPGRPVTRLAAAAALATLSLLHLGQLEGLPEAQAFAFTSLTLLVLYKDPRPMWVAAALYVSGYAGVALAHRAGSSPDPFGSAQLTPVRAALSLGLLTTEVVLASVVARTLRRRTLHDAEQLEASEALRRELQLTRDRLVQSEKLATAGQLAAGVGHEINNPLAFIIGNLEFARLRLAEARPQLTALRDGDDVLASLAEAVEGAQRIATIVRDLKNFAVSQDDELGATDVRTSLEFALTMARPQIRHRAVVERDYGDVPPVDATDTRLGQVFLVLLVNAAQAMRDGGSAENRIRVKTARDPDGQVRITVSDTGPGIAPEHLGRIFDPFFTTRGREGTGLGLSIAWNIVTSLGGRLEVVSQPGQGAAFHVLLPPSTRAAPARRLTTRAPPVLARPPARVLVIDDEPNLAGLIARLMGPEVTVTAALSGREGLELIAHREFELVLCDVMMPDISGAQVYQTIAQHHARLLPRVVMMTGGAFTDESAKFVESLPSAVLEKPFGAGELRSLLALVRARAA